MTGINIIRGFTAHYSNKSESDIIKDDYLDNQIQLEFKFGTQQSIPLFIGNIKPNDMFEMDQIDRQIIQSYLKYSGSQNAPLFFDNSGQTNQKFNDFLDKVNIGKDKVILLNPQLIISDIHNIDGTVEFRQQISNWKQIINYLQAGMFLIFGTNHYDQNVLLTLIQLIIQNHKDYLNQISVTSYVSFKTDLQKYGGKGYLQFSGLIEKVGSIYGQQIVDDLVKKNLLRRLNWYTKYKEKEQEKRYWECPQCKQSFLEPFEKFKKMEQEFCSIKCLRAGLKKPK